MNKNQKWNLVTSAIIIGIAIVSSGMAYVFGVYMATDDVVIAAPAPVIVQSHPPIIIEVDGIDCVMAEEPVLHFYTRPQTVQFTVECDEDIIDYYRTAVDPTTIVDNPSTK